jgi:hypothetical protein
MLPDNTCLRLPDMSNAYQYSTSTDEWLLEQVRTHIAHHHNVLLQVSASEEIIIAAAEQLYYRQQRNGNRIHSLTPTRSLILAQDDIRLQIARSDGRPLSELLWNCALLTSAGNLLPGCRRDDVVQLTRWPNLTRVHATANSMRIAALLTARPTSLVLASRILDIDESEIFSFYSAARYAGLTRTMNRPDSLETTLKPVNPKRLSLISKLMGHLKTLQTQRRSGLSPLV